MFEVSIAQLQLWINKNYDNLLSGAVIALIQLGVTCLLVELILARREMKRWGRARLELSARMLVLAQTLSGALANYMVAEDDRVLPAENLQRALTHIKDMSESLDAMLAISGRGFATEWFTELALIADRLRSTAIYAELAARNWQEFADDLPRHNRDGPPRSDEHDSVIAGLCTIRQTDIAPLPAGKPERQQCLFGQSTFNCCAEVADVSQRLAALVANHFTEGQLNRSAVFKSLQILEEKSSSHLISEVTRHVDHLRNCVRIMEARGLHLRLVPEITNYGRPLLVVRMGRQRPESSPAAKSEPGAL